MPYQFFYDGSEGDFEERRGSDGEHKRNFSFDPANGQFRPQDLEPDAKLILDALLELGAKSFFVRYDGGNDEGFAHADNIHIGEVEYNLPAAAKRLLETTAGKQFIAQQRPQAAKWRYRQPPTNERLLMDGLEDLASNLACKLLGDGYGTGEYELYGAFTADLKTGTMTDDPNVQPPGGM